MKLISCTDKVIELVKEDFNNGEYPKFNFRDKVNNYANFLKQPLELWMFVPCDEDGNVIPDKENHFTRKELDYWEQAKERCLFEGFEKVFEDDFKTVYCNSQLHICFGSKNIYLGRQKDNRIYNKEILMTIEDLVKYNLQLTATAQKQLGL